MDRLKGAFVSTDATQGDGAPALRVQFVAATDVSITTALLADNLSGRMGPAFVVTDSAQGDGAPALRARTV